MNKTYNLQDVRKIPCSRALGDQSICTQNIMYPEIYYKVQPFVILSCDQMNSCLEPMDQKMVDKMAEDIYTKVCIMYPDLEEYAGKYTMNVSAEDTYRNRDRVIDEPYNRGGFRRRGILQDFIDLLLLNELFRRV